MVPSTSLIEPPLRPCLDGNLPEQYLKQKMNETPRDPSAPQQPTARPTSSRPPLSSTYWDDATDRNPNKIFPSVDGQESLRYSAEYPNHINRKYTPPLSAFLLATESCNSRVYPDHSSLRAFTTRPQPPPRLQPVKYIYRPGLPTTVEDLVEFIDNLRATPSNNYFMAMTTLDSTYEDNVHNKQDRRSSNMQIPAADATPILTYRLRGVTRQAHAPPEETDEAFCERMWRSLFRPAPPTRPSFPPMFTSQASGGFEQQDRPVLSQARSVWPKHRGSGRRSKERLRGEPTQVRSTVAPYFSARALPIRRPDLMNVHARRAPTQPQVHLFPLPATASVAEPSQQIPQTDEEAESDPFAEHLTPSTDLLLCPTQTPLQALEDQAVDDLLLDDWLLSHWRQDFPSPPVPIKFDFAAGATFRELSHSSNSAPLEGLSHTFDNDWGDVFARRSERP